ncbi:hypothetical protein O3M35_010959 [Rhynocoris fuscipes]|uniref:Uncharacterized protein n=1 Tax=Rhynocoris fuscipes TaxID=488301 RepID=A0AAW1D4K6_9HEMI
MTSADTVCEEEESAVHILCHSVKELNLETISTTRAGHEASDASVGEEDYLEEKEKRAGEQKDWDDWEVENELNLETISTTGAGLIASDVLVRRR